MTGYSTVWIVPKKDYGDDEPWATTTKTWLPDIVLIPFLDGDEFDDNWRKRYPTGWQARLERTFALRDE